MTLRRGHVLLACWVASTALVTAQDTPASQTVNVGVLVQIVADAQADRPAGSTNGFSVANARLLVNGRLAGGWTYDLVLAATNAPGILDAKISYPITQDVTVDAGLFKVPVSREYLTSAASIDFVDRSRAVAALRPGRQVGVQGRAMLGAGLAEIRVGLFNGNEGGGGNTDNDLLAAGRINVKVLRAVDGTGPTGEIGLSAAVGHDRSSTLLGSPVQGDRRWLGADARVTAGDWLVAGEVLVAEGVESATMLTRRPFGYQGTVGRMLTSRSQVLMRFDAFEGDGLVAASKAVLVGYNLWPTAATELQVNVIVPVEGQARGTRAQVNLQVAV